MYKPLIAVTIGDPAGIGPEIVIKSLANPEIQKTSRCIVIGSDKILKKAMEYANMPNLEINTIKNMKGFKDDPKFINTINIDNIKMDTFKIGTVSGECGKAAYDYIAKSIDLANNGEVDAVATAPINKVALHEGGVDFIGHTEIFAKLTNTNDPLTMFEVEGMRVFFLTRHVSLRKACDLITEDRIIDYVHRCKKALEQLGITDGTMAIAGLNPHCGEHGLFGDEEDINIFPAVEKLKKEGINVEGPIGADSVFHLALVGKYNSVLSLYHDQGHIATKTRNFEKTIAITLGMPILRTSVDHGTAMDIAGSGKASDVSMIEAIRLAVLYAPRFKDRRKNNC